MLKTDHLKTIVGIMCEFKDSPATVVRAAFVLGNLTTHFE
jgi:hypothetical protein